MEWTSSSNGACQVGSDLFCIDDELGEKDAENIVNLCYEVLRNVNGVEPVGVGSYIWTDETLKEHGAGCRCPDRHRGGWTDGSSVLPAQEYD